MYEGRHFKERLSKLYKDFMFVFLAIKIEAS